MPHGIQGDLRVRDAMSAPVVTARLDATVGELAELMLEGRIGSVVVVGAHVEPVGIVTETDLEVAGDPVPLTSFRWPRAFGAFVWSESSLEEAYEAARGRSAAEVMSTPLVTTAPEESLWNAMRTMVARDVKRLPVVDEGRLVGLISRRDLLKCLAGSLPTG